MVEAAREELDDRDLGQLRGFIDSEERTFRWKAGQWVERRQTVPVCGHCGLDLPPGLSLLARHHKHCQQTAAKRRQRARIAVQGASWRALS